MVPKQKQTYEIRLRQVPATRYQALEKIAAAMREKTSTAALEKLIDRYQGDQDAIATLQKRNTELHRNIAKYYEREGQARELIQDMQDSISDNLRNGIAARKKLDNLLKQYTRKPATKKKK